MDSDNFNIIIYKAIIYIENIKRYIIKIVENKKTWDKYRLKNVNKKSKNK